MSLLTDVPAAVVVDILITVNALIMVHVLIIEGVLRAVVALPKTRLNICPLRLKNGSKGLTRICLIHIS